MQLYCLWAVNSNSSTIETDQETDQKPVAVYVSSWDIIQATPNKGISKLLNYKASKYLS